MEKASKIASANGMDIFFVRAPKFKTNSINIFFHDSLSKENAAKNALIPAVLRRGCETHPTLQDIANYLEELYGASFDCGVTKKGEHQIVQFYIEHISDKYTGEKAELFEKCFELVFEILTKPVLENGAFKKDFVEQEKENLRKLIESRVNDKAQLAVERCFETMCENEPFSVYDYGFVEDIEKIDEKNLYEHYQNFLEGLPVLVYITGDIEEEKLQKVISRMTSLKRGNIKTIPFGEISKEVKDVKEKVEKMSVNQGKLSLGFRTNTGPNEMDYYNLLVCNTILGGGIHSKLFQNVREKESLAYYAFSRLEKFKGLMVISSGIEIENKDKAVKIILQQLEDIKQGKISDYEYESSINTIETGVRSIMDGQLQIVDFFLSQEIAKHQDDFESLIHQVKKVTKDDVVKVAGKIKLDTVYFLTAG
ncbi:MAG: insulinase family protein [Clostridia bacterium]|nr:insulinase family protein [Clostridia bacterium]